MTHLFAKRIGTKKTSIFLKFVSALIILTAADFFAGADSLQAQTLIPELRFTNPKLKTGRGCSKAGEDGAVYLFENVGWGVDALVTIMGRSSAEVSLSSADIQGPEQNPASGTGDDNAWQPSVKFGNGTAQANENWWMEFKVSFVKHENHRTPLAVSQFIVTGLDIDGDGDQLHEYQSYYKMRWFALQQETAVFASTVQGSETDPWLKGKRFDGSPKEYPGISLDAEDAKVKNFCSGSSSMIVRLGAETGDSGSAKADRMYGLSFKSLAFDVTAPKKVPENMYARTN